MKHLGTKQIETERLILRKFSLDDADAMYRNWAADDEVTKYLTWPSHSSVDVTKMVLADWIEAYKNDDSYQWAIVLKEINEPIGSIAVVDKNDETEMVHIGYCISRKYWHKGITSEALKALIDFFFNEVGVKRVESRHDPRNPHSGGVMKKCGMIYEGTRKNSDKNNQGICDASYYAITKS